jgi:D-serine deaminase-like pyridoxal phosphate-dependent protein
MSARGAAGDGRLRIPVGDEQFATPALVVDLDVFEANVAAMAALLEGSGKTVRPHVKTHRTPELARRQLGGSAVGVTCATVGEAEAMAAAGIDDILVANEVVDPTKMARLASLAQAATVTVAVDSVDPLDGLSSAAVAAGATIRLLIDVDILLHRCGVTSPEEALDIARRIEDRRGLELVGIMGYEGRVRLSVEDRTSKIARAYAVLARIARVLRAAGYRIDVVSGSGTSTLREALADPTITELQTGVYALMEPELLVMDLPFRCATVLRNTVISRRPGRLVLDGGRRSVGLENGLPVPANFEGRVVAVNDEHTIIEMADPVPPLGSSLDVIPGQVRTTFNLHDRVWVARGDEVVDCWPVSARGRSW